jgi:hypothetical protein
LDTIEANKMKLQVCKYYLKKLLPKFARI